MFDVGGGELIFILLAIVLLFGPKKLPELARSFGKGMAQLRKAQSDFQRNLNSLEDEIDSTVKQTFEPTQTVPAMQNEQVSEQVGELLPEAGSEPNAEVFREPFAESSAESSDSNALPPLQQLTPIRIQPAEGSLPQTAPVLTASAVTTPPVPPTAAD